MTKHFQSSQHSSELSGLPLAYTTHHAAEHSAGSARADAHSNHTNRVTSEAGALSGLPSFPSNDSHQASALLAHHAEESNITLTPSEMSERYHLRYRNDDTYLNRYARSTRHHSIQIPHLDRHHEQSSQSQAFTITSAVSNPAMFTLPWSKPLAQWSHELIVDLPRGISRHIVRFVRVGSEIYALKEISHTAAQREYEILRQLQKIDAPSVVPVAIVEGRTDAQGDPLDAILVTKHLKYSLPYRTLFARTLRSNTVDLLIDALAVLLVRLHLVGLYWGDVSLSNVLFRRDADSFVAFLVDAETGNVYETLSDGQRHYDIDIARTNIIGELMDLHSGNLLPHDVDELEVGNRLVERYETLWSTLTDVEEISIDEMWRIEHRVNTLNQLGFDVDELEVRATADGKYVTVRPMVVDAGYASRKLLRLTGLDVQENQARRLLNDIDSYRTSTWRRDDDLEIVATDWLRDVFEPIVRMIPERYRPHIAPAQFFYEVLVHRLLLAEIAGHDVHLVDAATSCIEQVLPTMSMVSQHHMHENCTDCDCTCDSDEMNIDDIVQPSESLSSLDNSSNLTRDTNAVYTDVGIAKDDAAIASDAAAAAVLPNLPVSSDSPDSRIEQSPSSAYVDRLEYGDLEQIATRNVEHYMNSNALHDVEDPDSSVWSL